MFIEVVRTLRDRGLDVRIVIPQDGPLRGALDELGMASEVVPFAVLRKATLTAARVPRFLIDLLRSTLAARRTIRRWSPSIVYVSTIIAPQWLVAGRQAGIPTICHVHELANNLPRVLATALYAQLCLATLTIANSEASRAFILELQPSLKERALTIVNGLDLPQTSTARPQGVEKRILVVGRLGRHKGQDIALDAFAILRARGWNAVLELAGSVFPGNEWYEAELRARALRLGVSEWVRFLGFRSDVKELYAAADVVVVPSRTEPFGLVAIEAMAAERPVVASNVGGLAEIVRDGITGWSVVPEDAAGIADAVDSILTDPDRAHEIARRAAMIARDRYSHERFARALLTAFERCGTSR